MGPDNLSPECAHQFEMQGLEKGPQKPKLTLLTSFSTGQSVMPLSFRGVVFNSISTVATRYFGTHDKNVRGLELGNSNRKVFSGMCCTLPIRRLVDDSHAGLCENFVHISRAPPPPQSLSVS